MKRSKLLVLTFLLILSTLSPMTVHAEGNGNINNGGGGLGEGTDTNFWNTGDEGVRVTVVSASDGSAVSASIDLTNKQPNDIRVQFGKVCKSQYRSGTVLTPDTGSYSYINPTQSLPKIITTSSGSASLAVIKSYFTDEQVIRSIAGYVGMNYDTLIGGDYKLLLEPIAYVTFEGVRTAFTATEAAMYNQVLGTFKLKGIKRAMRGVPQIEVTFDIDVNGILNVSAKDLATGKEQSITITASSNMSDKDIERAMEDAKAYESEDQEKRDAIGSYNEGENMLYKGEAYLAQHKKELSREQRSELKSAISDLKHSMKRIKPQNITEEQGRAIKEASERLNQLIR